MATFEFVLPELGEGMEAGDVVQVLVTVGESITAEQPVLELETDKAVVEVPAPVSGTVKAIHVQAGDKAAVGQLLLTVETPASAAAAAQAPRTPTPAAVSLPPTSENGENKTATDKAVSQAARASCPHCTNAFRPVSQRCGSPSSATVRAAASCGASSTVRATASTRDWRGHQSGPGLWCWGTYFP